MKTLRFEVYQPETGRRILTAKEVIQWAERLNGVILDEGYHAERTNGDLVVATAILAGHGYTVEPVE